MTNWTRYTLTYDDTNDQVIVDVSDAPETIAMLNEINSFLTGSEERLAAANGDVTTAVLKMLCTSVLWHTLAEFDGPADFVAGKVEGWPALDGSCGIRLVNSDQMHLDGDVSIIKVSAGPAEGVPA